MWLLFAPKNWKDGRYLELQFCQSVSVVGVVSTLIGGGDTPT